MIHAKFQDHRTFRAVSEEKIFENNGYVHIYSTGAGADNPLGSICFSLTILFSQYSQYSHLLQDFLH